MPETDARPGFDRVYVMHPGPREWPTPTGGWRGLWFVAEHAGQTSRHRVEFGFIRTLPGGLPALMPYILAEMEADLAEPPK